MLVTGPNGVGKTNLLEALHVGSQGFSPRTRAEAQVIRFDAGAARVALAGSQGGAPVATQVTLARGEPKRVRLNGAPLASTETLRTRLSALVFLPDRLAVIKAAPLVRRAYLDRMLGRLRPAQADLPSDYMRALAQRNEALRRTRAGVSTREAVSPWTERVVSLGNELDVARAALVGALAPRFADEAERLGLGAAALRYEAEPVTVAAFDERYARDLARGTTGLGPHLRELAITAGGRELRTFGSQGEQRAAVLALVLAEARLLAEARGTQPLLLLDDVLSELDAGRRRALLGSLPPGAQTVVTATSPEALPADARAPDLVVRVSAGHAEAA